MAQAPRPRRTTTKTATTKKSPRPTAKKPSPPQAPLPPRDWKKTLSVFRTNIAVRVIILLAIVSGIFIFNPESGIIPSSPNEKTNTNQSYKVDIRSRALSDPHQGDLKIKVGSRALLNVTTDEDGRLDLVSPSRDVFNPIFSNVGNTLSIPTDRAESFRLEFHPASDSSTSATPIIIGDVIIQN